MNTNGDNYLKGIISNNKAAFISLNDYRLSNIIGIINSWAGAQLSDLIKSGSSAKDTAIKGVSDIDLFISLKSDTNGTLKDIYNSLDDFVKLKGIKTRRQNVSIGITQNSLEIDLVPGKKQSGYQNFHSIYVSKKDTWTQTNIKSNIDLINNSNRKDEIILTKIWRKDHSLDFPSIYLELIVLDALEYKPTGELANNFWTVLKYLRDEFVDKIITDPSNTNNNISDVLYKYEKETIVAKAKESLLKKDWSEIVW